MTYKRKRSTFELQIGKLIMAREVTILISMDEDIKEKVVALYRNMGTSFEEAVRIFAEQSIQEKLSNPFYLNRIGLAILEENLGCVGTTMFLQQLDRGSGDYTKERQLLLDSQTIEDFEHDLIMMREERSEE
jgi:DNA-damage-inducible protein J